MFTRDTDLYIYIYIYIYIYTYILYLRDGGFVRVAESLGPLLSAVPPDQARRVEVVLRGQSRIPYSLPPAGFRESEIHLASATGKPLVFLWNHVQGFIK